MAEKQLQSDSVQHACESGQFIDSRLAGDYQSPESPRTGFNPDFGDITDDARTAIYGSLASHQRLENWFGREFIEQLQMWVDCFDTEFNLQVREIVLRIDVLPCNRYGHFRVGHNGFGLKGEIALNSRYLNNRPFWQVLGTLLHELLHAWQHIHGRPSRRDHHNDEFRRKARECGLSIDERGVTSFPASSRFKDLLRRYGLDLPEADITPAGVRIKGKSKLKKWACECTTVRCAVASLSAQCLTCGHTFVQVE